jgi:hypothetical protein
VKSVYSSPAVLLFVASALACDNTNEPQDSPPGELAIAVRTTGTLPDPDGYVLVIDDSFRLRVPANSDTVVSLYAGNHVIQVEDLAGPCVTAGEGGWL